MEAVFKLLVALVKPILFKIPLWAWIVIAVAILIWYVLDWIEYSDSD